MNQSISKSNYFSALSGVKSGKSFSNLLTASPTIPNYLSKAPLVFKSATQSLKPAMRPVNSSIKSKAGKISNNYFVP
jgi:hypothetical protein